MIRKLESEKGYFKRLALRHTKGLWLHGLLTDEEYRERVYAIHTR